MKFFKQTKETKRKISFFMALAMIISLLPVSPVVKAAENTKDNITDSSIYVVNECGTHVEVSEILTGPAAAAKEASEAATSAVVKVVPKSGYKFAAVSSGSINVNGTGVATLGGITVSNTAGTVVTGVTITVEKVTSAVEGATTSCAVSSSAIEGDNIVAKVSIKEATNNSSNYAEIKVDAVTGSGIKITLSYDKATEKDPDDTDKTENPKVTFDKTGLTGATVTAKCGNDTLDTTKTTAITSGSVIALTITPEGEKVFKNPPVVKAGDTAVNVAKAGSSYNATTAAITADTTISITGTAEEDTGDETEEYNVSFDVSGLTNAKANAILNDATEAFTSGKLTKTDVVSITVTPEDGYSFTEKAIPSIVADGAKISTGASLGLQADGSYKAAVTEFTKATTIKVSGAPDKSPLEVEDTQGNIGSAKLDVDTATLEKNKDKLIAAFGTASKAAIEGVLTDGGKISVALTVTAGSISSDEKDLIINDTELKVTEADLAKGVALDITLIAKCYDKDGELVGSANVNSLNDAVTITMSVDGLVEAEASNVTRTYYIIKIHDGKAEKIECTYDKGKKTISFDTKEFSTYILMYEDKKDDSQGGDDNKPGDDKPVTPGGSQGIGSYIPSGATATPTAAPTAVPSVSPSATPDVTATGAPGTTPSDSPAEPGTNDPSASSTPAPSQKPSDDDNNGDDKVTGTTKVKVGKNVTINSSKYKVTSVSGTRAVQFTSGKKNAKTVVVPATVKISGKNYKVTSIAKNAFKGNKKLKKVTIGVNVNKIGKAAFKGCKNLKSVVIKTKKLTAKKVGANAFKGINKKATFKVPKNKVKAYKKIVKAKGAAKTVKVKK